MAEYGRALFTYAGYAFFGPWGALIGGFIGGLLFPTPTAKGPRLNELNVQHSTVGAPIPIVYGTAVLAGNIIWSGGLVEEEHEGGGGKGGPSGPTTYSYSVDVAIGICEGPITGIRRIWGDADLLYDATDDTTLTERLQGVTDIAGTIAAIRAASAQLDFDLYLGDEDQLPDPTIESFVGVGNTPAYRGLAYIVFPRFQLERFGNRIPNFRFEVFSGAEVECGIYSAGHLEPWAFYYDASVRDPRNPDNQHLYGYTENGGNSFYSWATALADLNAATDHPDNPFIGPELPQGSPAYAAHGWSITQSGGGGLSNPCGIQESDPLSGNPGTDYGVVWMTLDALHIDSNSCPEVLGGPSGFSAECAAFWAFLGGKGRVKYILQGTGGSSAYWVATNHNQDPGIYFEGMTNASDDVDHYIGQTIPCADLGGGSFDLWKTSSHDMEMRRWWAPQPGVYGQTWTRVAGTFKSLRSYIQPAGIYGVVTSYPKDPTLRSDDPNYDSQEFWEAAYAAAVADNDSLAFNDPNRIPEDWVYGVDYPDERSSHISNLQSGIVWQSECTAVATECVPMATIVADICRRAGLRTDTATQIDVSDLTTCVHGYIIGRQMSARDAMGPLRTFGLWDAVESQALLKFVERGHAIVATLTADDLGAHEINQPPPSSMEVSRIQEKDLPRRVRLHFPNFKHDHEITEQYASRISTEAIDEVDIELPVSMDPDTGKQLADIMLKEAWVSRNGYRFSLDNWWLALEPTDCVEIPVDGQTERVRIVSIDYSIGGILKIEAVRDDDGAYVSTAVAVDGQPSGGAPGSSGGGPICSSAVVLLDIPRLRESDTDAGYYAAIYGLCPDFWRCAELYRSNDGGATYQRVARTDFETTVGEIFAITGPATDPTLPGDSPPYDAANSITVNLLEGTLASVSDDQIAAGQNLAAIGRDGRWVIIQFKTATLDTGDQWTLTDLIWGVNDTEHLLGTTVVGDTFVLLSDADLLRIPESADAIGVEKQFKVVSCGESIDAVTAFAFTTWGLSYQRLCPSTVLSASLTEPPTGAVDGDAYLIPSDTSLSGLWATHGGEIATWSDDTDSWVYCTPVPGTIIHIIGDSSDDVPGDDVISGGDGTYTPSPWAPATATFITESDEQARLPNSFRLDEGTGVVFTKDTSGGVLTISATGSQAALQFNDEGVNLGTAGTVDTVDFVGAGVTATRVGDVVTVTVPVSQQALQFEDEGSNLGTAGTVTEVDFVGANVVASRATNKVTVTISGSSATTSWKDPVRAATTVAGTLATSFENGDTIDGVTLATNDRILIKNQAAGAENGIYTVNASGAPTRATDADVAAELVGAAVFVSEGTANADKSYVCTTNAPITLNTTALVFRELLNAAAVPFSPTGTVAATDVQAAIAEVDSEKVAGPGSATDNALARFDGTTGKLIQNSATILSDTDTVSTPNAAADEVGYKGIPQNSISADYTLVLADVGKQIYKGSGGAVTVTIPANGSVAYPVGTCIEGINDDTESMTVAITTDTLVLSPGGSTGSRTVASRGWFVLRKVTSTRWFISGAGVT